VLNVITIHNTQTHKHTLRAKRRFRFQTSGRNSKEWNSKVWGRM